jgi:hypothetical protein
MDQHLVLYWLIATKQYLEAEQHNKQSRGIFDPSIRSMIAAVEDAIEHYNREVESYRNYEEFIKKGEFPW